MKVPMKKACMCVGDAVWTLTYTVDSDTSVTILNFDKEDNDGYMFPDTLGRLDSIKEGENRIAESVIIDHKEYTVSNPQNVYTYKQPH